VSSTQNCNTVILASLVDRHVIQALVFFKIALGDSYLKPFLFFRVDNFFQTTNISFVSPLKYMRTVVKIFN